VKEGDYISQVLEVNTLENLLVFTQKGQYFLLPVHQVPEFKWKDPGTAIVNVIPLAKDDRITSVLAIKSFEEPDHSLVFVTRKGQVKRTELKEYITKRSGAVAACKVGKDDEVLSVHLSTGGKDIMLITKEAMAIRFREDEVNPMGRVSGGVRGIQLKDTDEVVSVLWVEGDEGEVAVLSDLGYAKRSLLLDYAPQSRGCKGVVTFEFKEGKRVKPNGSRIAGAFYCKEQRQLTVMTKEGQARTISSESVPLTERKHIGKLLVSVEKQDEITELIQDFNENQPGTTS
jgi:topoisomerase-4 subunit A